MKTQYLFDRHAEAVEFAKMKGWSISFRVRGKKEYVTIKAPVTLRMDSYFTEFRDYRDTFLPNAMTTSQSSDSGFTARLNPDSV